jgi:PAS domain S-box-containing protein
LVEAAPDAIFLVNGDGEIELANDKAEEVFGYTHNELLGKAIEELIPNRFREQHRANRESYIAHPAKRAMGEHEATYAMRKDGTEFPIAATLNATATPGGTLVTCIIRDLSERPAPEAKKSRAKR